MATLEDEMKKAYGVKFEESVNEPLVEGEYDIHSFRVMDSLQFGKIAFLSLTNGREVRTTSKMVIGQLLGKPGEVLNGMIERDGKARIKIISHKANTGRTGLMIKVF